VALAVVVLGAPAAARVVAARFDERLRAALVAPEAANATTLASDVVLASVPLLAMALGAVLVVGLAQTSGVVAFGRSPGRRVEPIALSRLFERWGDAARAACAAVVVCAIALHVLRQNAVGIADATGVPSALLGSATGACLASCQVALGVVFAVAALDVVQKRRAWFDRWRPTAHEAERERREASMPEAVRRERSRRRDELLAETAGELRR
jgi:flagellar biosynthesis protein FlhB